jgi:two-component system KDP operon response regulator KdpE
VAGAARILLVEDDYDTRAAMATVLGDAGYDVLEAGDGRTALELCARSSPALVLLDLSLPDGPGLELLAQMRALPGGHDLIVLAVSGFQERTDAAGAAAGGERRLDGYLRKPFGAARLLDMVGAALSKRRPPA